MKGLTRASQIVLVLLAFLGSTRAQSRAEVGLDGAGDRDRGYKAASFGIVGRCVIKIGGTAIDASAEYVIHAPKTGTAPDGKTLATDVLVRHYVLSNVYAVAGIDVSKLSSFLVDATATSAATGAGLDIGDLRVQALYEPPDFTSGQSLSHYRADIEYVRRLSEKHYISFRWQGRTSRFDRGTAPGTLTGEKFGMIVSVVRFF
jgi:hypothetical protein